MPENIFIGRPFGIPFRIHWSWFIALILISWSLGTGVVSTIVPELAGNQLALWALGCISALGMFGSVLLHELGHAVVAKAVGIPVRGIRLFVFGGVMEMGGEPQQPDHEIKMALGGPAVTVLLIVLFGVVYWILQAALSRSLPMAMIHSVVTILLYLNIVLLVFNMIPAFPLDGGRVLRAIIWKANGHFYRATRAAGSLGFAFAAVLFVLGIWNIAGGQVVQGLWSVFLGLFLYHVVRSSIENAYLQHYLSDLRVGDLLVDQSHFIPFDATLEDMLSSFFMRLPHKSYAIVQDNSFLGMVSLRHLQHAGPGPWADATAADIADRRVPALSVNESALNALMRMNEWGYSRLPVVEEGRFLGVLAKRDILDFLEVRAMLPKRKSSPSESA